MTFQRVALVGAALLVAGSLASAAEPIITTYAGGGIGPTNGDGGPAKSAMFTEPTALEVDTAGNVYVSDRGQCRVRKINAAGVITTFAGNGESWTANRTPQNVPATSIALCPSGGMAIDKANNLYVGAWNRIHRITPAGSVTTIAGTGADGFSGDGGPATQAKFTAINDIEVDGAGNVYMAANMRIRMIDTHGIVRTIAGTGVGGSTGDGGPATSATFHPTAIEVDSGGNVVFVDIGGGRHFLRRISNGIVTRIGGGPFRIDPVAANADMLHANALAFDKYDNLYLSIDQNIARMISAQGILTTFAGVYNDSTFDPYGAWRGFAGDGGPASQAVMDEPRGIAVDASGNVFIADTGNVRIRKVTPVPPPRDTVSRYQFEPAQQWALGATSVEMVAVGDIDGDRRTDALIVTDTWGSLGAHANDHKIFWYRQGADGKLAAPVARLMPASRYVNAAVVASINHDAYGDVVVSNNLGLWIFLGGPTGLASTPILWPGITNGEAQMGIAAVDLNRDGHMDVVAATAGPGVGGTGGLSGRTIFYGNGSGGLLRTNFVPGQYFAGKPLIPDINRDGWPDLLTVGGSGVAISLNDTLGAFLPTEYVAAEGGYGHGIAIGDLDSDGLRDIIVSCEGNAPDSGLLHFRETSPGVYAFEKRWGTYDAAVGVEIADMDNQGGHDLLIHHDGWSSIGYMEQTRMSNGKFWLDTEVKYHVRTSGNMGYFAMAIGDLNGDRCRDVATSETNEGLQVLYGQCPKIRNGATAPLPPFRNSGTSFSSQSAAAMPTPEHDIWVASQALLAKSWQRMHDVVSQLTRWWQRLWAD